MEYDREKLINVLIYHWPTETSGCWCGWNELGKLFPAHVADIYEWNLEHGTCGATTVIKGKPVVEPRCTKPTGHDEKHSDGCSEWD